MLNLLLKKLSAGVLRMARVDQLFNLGAETGVGSLAL